VALIESPLSCEKNPLVEVYSFDNPVFRTYAIAASLAMLKMLGQALSVVAAMMRKKGGFLNPEDTRRTFSNPDASPAQIEPDADVERQRRMHRNDGENIPLFLASGFLLVAAQPSSLLAAVLLYGFVAVRIAHTIAYATRQDHEIRATFFSVGLVIQFVIIGYVLFRALRL
jgi:glutathione S-transferase